MVTNTDADRGPILTTTLVCALSAALLDLGS